MASAIIRRMSNECLPSSPLTLELERISIEVEIVLVTLWNRLGARFGHPFGQLAFQSGVIGPVGDIAPIVGVVDRVVELFGCVATADVAPLLGQDSVVARLVVDYGRSLRSRCILKLGRRLTPSSVSGGIRPQRSASVGHMSNNSTGCKRCVPGCATPGPSQIIGT